MGTEKNHREKERERERDARVHAPKKESHQKRFSKAPRDKSDSHLLSSTTFDAFPRVKDLRSFASFASFASSRSRLRGKAKQNEKKDVV